MNNLASVMLNCCERIAYCKSSNSALWLHWANNFILNRDTIFVTINIKKIMRRKNDCYMETFNRQELAKVHGFLVMLQLSLRRFYVIAKLISIIAWWKVVRYSEDRSFPIRCNANSNLFTFFPNLLREVTWKNFQCLVKHRWTCNLHIWRSINFSFSLSNFA